MRQKWKAVRSWSPSDRALHPLELDCSIQNALSCTYQAECETDGGCKDPESHEALIHKPSSIAIQAQQGQVDCASADRLQVPLGLAKLKTTCSRLLNKLTKTLSL